MKKGLIWGGLLLLAGGWVAITVYEFLDRESALRQKNVKAALAEQQRCGGRYLKFRTYEQFRARFKVPFVSGLAPERWAEEFSSLKDGMSEREVERILGTPDFARCDLNKEGDHFAGSTWKYEISVPQDFANESQNSVIEILFGPDGKLKEKNAVNVQARPSPATAASPDGTTIVPPAASTPAPAPVITPTREASPVPSPTTDAMPQ